MWRPPRRPAGDAHESVAKHRADTSRRRYAVCADGPARTREERLVGCRDGFHWLLRREAVRAAVDGLSADCRIPVLLWAVEGCSYVEVAEKLGVSEKVAAGRIRRGCDLLRSVVEMAS